MKEALKTVVLVLFIVIVVVTSVIGIVIVVKGLPIWQNEKNENIIESDSIVHCINPLPVYNTYDDRIIYDKSTKVMYISRGAGCAYTPMYNADGTLRTWDGE